MKRSKKQVALYFVIVLSVFPFFSNCSEPFKSFESVEFSSVDPGTLKVDVTAVNEKAILSSDQVLKSMSEVTEVEIDTNLASAYRLQQDVLAASYDLNSVNAPMLNGITNLAGQFCTKLVNKEMQQTASSRKFFSAITFPNAPENLKAEDFNSTVQALAMNFWGREASGAEVAILNDARTAFISGKDGNLAASTSSRSLFTLVCTGMLSSFDSYTF